MQLYDILRFESYSGKKWRDILHSPIGTLYFTDRFRVVMATQASNSLTGSHIDRKHHRTDKCLIAEGLSVKLSVFACFLFRLELHKQRNTLIDELEAMPPD